MNKTGNIEVSVIIPTHNRLNDVTLCLNSVLESKNVSFEVIIVDNASSDDTYGVLSKKYSGYKNINIIYSEINMGAGGGRNLGASKAIGKNLLFIDSDNVIEQEMITKLNHLLNTGEFSMVGPLMLYLNPPNKVWTYFADINFYTSKAFYRGNKENYKKSIDTIIESGHIPNCFMVSKKDFELINGFDEYYMVMYEEADFAERLKKKSNKKIVILTTAITKHNVNYDNQNITLGIQSQYRAFLLARNRIYFMKKNASYYQFIIFLSIFLPLITAYYITRLSIRKEFKNALSYLNGTFTGLKF